MLHRFSYSKVDFKNAIFGENPLASFLILLMNNQPIGFANYTIDHRNFTVNLLANLYVNDLFIKKLFRRMKGASLLMNKHIEIAQQNNCGRIEGIVLAENTEAVDFYKTYPACKIISDKLHYLRLELGIICNYPNR
ncbi:MAG: GNAT family N-acetyltransferase [Tatlockia sp.]|nr:GNAT family N-acetyltransferase [Tatlockia sp.]